MTKKQNETIKVRAVTTELSTRLTRVFLEYSHTTKLVLSNACAQNATIVLQKKSIYLFLLLSHICFKKFVVD